MDCIMKYHRYKIISIAITALALCFFSLSGSAAEPAPSVSAAGGYDLSKDSFYSKKNIYVTWIMIWNGSTETHWWKPDDYNGCKVLVDGKWQSINWNAKNHIKTYFDAIRAAGMNVIVVDFTNGFRWEWQAKSIQQLCLENNMKFAVAFNPNAGKDMESGCRKIWETYASPVASYSSAYLYKDGKPLVVLYTWREGYKSSIEQTGPFRQKFSTVWASGEDSDKNKWGWQLEPNVGPVPSPVSMFVTGSVKFDSPHTTEDKWRKNLSWLDYSFLQAKKNNPKFIIVGSFDDVHERNAWIVADTANAKPGWQMRNIFGALDPNSYYKRVYDWVLKGKPAVIEGGLIRDGAYRLVSSDGRLLGVPDNRLADAKAVLKKSSETIDDYIWLYHLGSNEYKIIKLNAGLPLDANDSSVIINWDSESASQRWIVKKQNEKFIFINKANGLALDYSDSRIVLNPQNPALLSQRWSLAQIAVLPK